MITDKEITETMIRIEQMETTKRKEDLKRKLMMKEIEKDDHIIYKITNTVNGKIYIGQTKQYRGNSYFGIEGRFREHINDSMNGHSKCTNLSKAIREYGKDKFKITEICRCNEHDVNNKEKEMISEYDSTNPEIGYNIALGGSGRSVVNVNEEIRKHIAIGNKSKLEKMNIKPYHRKGKLVGYVIKRREKGKQYGKYFTSTSCTLEENKKQAEKWLQDLKDGKNPKNDYNKSEDIPKDISVIHEKGVVIGYRVMAIRQGINYNKTFQSKKTDLKILLDRAKDYLNKFENGERNIDVKGNVKKIEDLPKGIGVVRKDGKIIGYQVKIIRNKITHSQSFQDITGTRNEELLEKAKKYLEELKIKLEIK